MRRVVVAGSVVVLLLLLAGTALRLASALRVPQPFTWGTEGVDLYGDALPAGALARLGTRRFRATTWTNLVWRDAKHLLCGGFDREIVEFDATTGARTRTLPGHRETLLDPPTGWSFYEVRSVLAGGAAPTTRDDLDELRLLADGRTLISTGQAVRVWDLASGTGRVACVPGGGNVAGFVVDADARTLAYEWCDVLRRFDLASGAELRRTPLRVAEATNVWGEAFAPRGDRVAVCVTSGEGARLEELLLLDADSGEQVATIVEEGGRRVAVQFAEDSTQLDCLWWHGPPDDSRPTLVTYDAADGARVGELPLPPGSYIAEWSPGRGRLAVATQERGVVLLDARGTALWSRRECGWAGAFAFSPDGARLAWRTGGRVRVADAATGATHDTAVGHDDAVQVLEFAADGRTLVSRGADARTLHWDVASARCVADDPTDAPSPTAQLAFVDDAGVHVRDAPGAAERLLVASRRSAENDGEFALRLAAAARTDLPVLALVETRTPLPGETHSWRASRELRALDRTSGGVLWCVPATASTTVCVSADGALAAVGDWSATVQVLRTADGGARVTLDAPDAGEDFATTALALSADGQLLASGARDGSVRVWSLPTGRLLATLRGHDAPVHVLAFAPDGRVLASGSSDTTVLLWPVPDGAEP